jgi:hypothetical protein
MLTVYSGNFSREAGWNEILLWLDALRSQPGAALKKERANGTCKWVHEKGSYEKWRISEGSDRLWLIGKPGTLMIQPPSPLRLNDLI